MLKLSTKGRYGVRAMFELASAYGEGPMLMGAIAQKQGLSRKYLHALLTALKKSGLVKSTRGARGGYTLAKAPREILLSEIIEALEGPLAIVHCVRGKEKCPRSPNCSVQPLWQTLNSALGQILEQFTLADLLDNNASLAHVALKIEVQRADHGPRA